SAARRRIFLPQWAILAPIAGTLLYPHSGGGRAHPLRFGTRHLARLPLKDGDEFIRPHVSLVLGPFLLRELAFIRFGGQSFDPPLKFRVRSKIEDGFRFVRQNDLQDRANTPLERS